MNSSIQNISPIAYAKIAGLLYLLIAITGGFSIGYLPTVIIVDNDAASTAQNLLNNEGLLRLGIIADIFVFVFEIILTVMLFHLLKPVNKTISMVASYSRMAMSIIMGLNLVNYIIPLFLLSGSSYLDSFDQNQLNSLTLLFLNVHESVVLIWGIFFGIHLFALGYLVKKSTYFPKTIGLLMFVGSVGYISEALVQFSDLGSETVSIIVGMFLTLAVIGELSFAFWLMIKSLDENKWNEVLSLKQKSL